jgi:hypothetical protein
MDNSKVNSRIDLNALCYGAFAEKVSDAIIKVAQNIQDPNTPAGKKRKINITMTFAPNKTRLLVNVGISVTTALASAEAIDTQMVMGVDLRTGRLEIAEYDGQIPGQMTIGDSIEQWRETSEMIDKMVADASADKPLDLKNRGQLPGRESDTGTGEAAGEKSNVIKINKAAEA